MPKIKKYLTSWLVFMVNLILMGVGFLFIKNSEEAKNGNAKLAEETDIESRPGNSDSLPQIAPIPDTIRKANNTVEERITPNSDNISSSTSPTIKKNDTAPTSTPTINIPVRSSAKTRTS